MAKIIWNELAASQLEAHLDYAVEEFGQKCVRNWYRDILRIESRLTLQPLSYPRFQLSDTAKKIIVVQRL